MLILSDGGDTASKQQTASSATNALRTATNVSADVVAFGTETDQSTLAQFAMAGRGQLISAASASQLVSAFAKAAQSFTEQMLVTASVPPELSGKQELSRFPLRQAIRSSAELAVTMPGAVTAQSPTTQVRQRAWNSYLADLACLTFCVFLGSACCRCGAVTSSPENEERIAEVEGYRSWSAGTQSPEDVGLRRPPFASGANPP